MVSDCTRPIVPVRSRQRDANCDLTARRACKYCRCGQQVRLIRLDCCILYTYAPRVDAHFRFVKFCPPMQWPQLPDYGCFLRWPENGQGFIHPDDTPIATQLIPSPRVLKRVSFDGVYYHYVYGRLRFRLRPAMWLSIRIEEFEIGDQVETKGVGLERERFVATVWGMYYVQRKGCILYRLRRGEQLVPKLFAGDQLRLLTNKTTVRPPTTRYRAPNWNGEGETVPDTKLDE